MSDEALLIKRAQGGEEQAFTELVRQYYGVMRFVALPIVGEANVDEVVQEAWISVHKKLSEWQPTGSFKSWLLTITANAARSRYRKQKRENVLEVAEQDALGDRFAGNGHWQQVPSSWHEESPDALIQKQELMDCLNHKITSLPDKQRLVFALKDISQMPLDDIAQFISESAANVRVLLHRARARLYANIEHFQETGTC